MLAQLTDHIPALAGAVTAVAGVGYLWLKAADRARRNGAPPCQERREQIEDLKGRLEDETTRLRATDEKQWDAITSQGKALARIEGALGPIATSLKKIEEQVT